MVGRHYFFICLFVKFSNFDEIKMSLSVDVTQFQFHTRFVTVLADAITKFKGKATAFALVGIYPNYNPQILLQRGRNSSNEQQSFFVYVRSFKLEWWGLVFFDNKKTFMNIFNVKSLKTFLVCRG